MDNKERVITFGNPEKDYLVMSSPYKELFWMFIFKKNCLNALVEKIKNNNILCFVC